MKAYYRKIVWPLIAAMLAVSLTACSSSKENGGTASSAAPSSSESASTQPSPAEETADPMGRFDPPIEVTAVRSVATTMKFENGDTIDNNAWTKLYEKELGIKLKYLWAVDPSQYEQKLNVMMTTGSCRTSCRFPAPR